jgi:hypothetical protein
MTTTVKLKNSVTTTNAPISLQQGEVAINITDKKVWVGNAATTPVQLLGTGADGSFTNLAYSGTLTGGTGVITIGTNQLYKDASGNFGLGTIVPTTKLDIFTNQAAGFHYPLFFSALNSASAKKDYLQLGFSIQQGAAGTETGGFDLKALRNNSLVYLANYEGDTGVQAWRFYTEGSERLRITSTGNVGIGTSAPQGKFQVLNSGSIGLDTDSNTETIITGANLNATASQANLFIYSNSTATDGFGGSIAFGGFYNSNTVASFGRIAGVRNGGSFWGDLTFSTRSPAATMLERMRITSAGNVGIGTSSPTRLLDVRQTYTTDTIVAQIGNINNGNGSTPVATIFDFTEANGTSVSRIASIYTQSLGTTDLAFGTYSGGSLAEKMRITSTGLLQFNSGYGSVATAYGCRAWATFDGSANSDQTGTYTQSGTTVIVTVTAHGFTTGQAAFLDFTSGTAVDGSYIVTVVDANEFTVVQASRITTGFVTVKKSTIISSGNVSSISDNGTGTYTINFTTAMPDDNYALTGSCLRVSGNTGSQFMENEIIARTTFSVSVITTNQSGAAVNPLLVSIAVFR